MHRATRFLMIGLALVVLAVGAGAGVKGYLAYEDLREENEKLNEPPPPPERVFAEGEVEAVKGEIDVMPQIAGELIKVLVEDGDSVEKDQLLAVIDAKRQKDAVEVAEANLALAKARLKRVRAGNTETTRPPMHVAGDVSAPSGEPTEEEIQIARESVKLAERQLDQAKTEYDYRQVKAPASGKVLKVYRHAGDSVQPGRTPVVQIADTSELRIRLEVDEIELGKLKKGMKGVFAIRGNPRNVGRLTIKRVIPAFGPGSIRRVNTADRRDTRKARLLCEVTSSEVTLALNQRITAEFEIDGDDDREDDQSDESSDPPEDNEDPGDGEPDPDEPKEQRVPEKLREAEADWKDAIKARQRLVDDNPGEEKYRERLAIAHGRLGYVYVQQEETEKAEDEFARAIELDGDTRYPWYLPALVRAAVDDEKGYRAACRTVLDCFEKSDEREVLNQVAWTSAIGTDVIDDYRRVVKLTDRTMADVDGPMHHLQNTRGAVLYRADEFDEAAEQLEEAVADHWKGGTPWDWFFLAMAHHELGNADDAQDWLDKAVEWMDENDSESDEDESRPALGWDQRLELEILRQEAETLLTVRRA